MKNKNKKLNKQLGWFVGEYIIENYLPTISVDDINTKTVIQCTIGEADKIKHLTDVWFGLYNVDEKSVKSKESWNNLLSYRTELESKYLPKELKCHTLKIKPTNVKKFKDGLADALWNCDICHYSLKHKDIEIIQEKYNTVIKLKLDTEIKLLD